MHSVLLCFRVPCPLRCSQHLGARTPPWKFPSAKVVAALVTDGGEGVRRVDVSAATRVLVVVSALSGGAGGCLVEGAGGACIDPW